VPSKDIARAHPLKVALVLPTVSTQMASVFECPMITVNTTEGAAFGAALLAGVGAGVWSDVPAACTAVVKMTSEIHPNPVWVKAYQRTYPIYRGLYPALTPSFHQM
jgi:xylulokinase